MACRPSLIPLRHILSYPHALLPVYWHSFSSSFHPVSLQGQDLGFCTFLALAHRSLLL